VIPGWPIRLAMLAAAGVPAFSGWPLGYWADPVFADLTSGWLGYFLLVHLVTFLTCGPRRHADILAVAALVATPVVYGGAAVATLWGLVVGAPSGQTALWGAHYLRLAVNMLTVVPLALAMVIQVPYARLEQRLIEDRPVVGRRGKMALMSLRVCNHVIYDVIPTLLEVMREARTDRRSCPGRRGRWHHLTSTMIHVGVEGICSAICYIPLWAVEIARIPAPGAAFCKPADKLDGTDKTH
jgi:hypothetical protein